MKFCYHCMQEIADGKATVCPTCGKKLEVKEDYGRKLKPGFILKDRYLVGESIGAGGFGITYIGWDQNLKRKVCIKEFYPEEYCERSEDGITVTVGDETMGDRYKHGLESFMQEAKNLASLQDITGVVKVYTFFEQNNTGYIIMEYLEGMDVKSILKYSGNKADYEWTRKIILSVLYILREIHKRGVIHRDIAPDNIFVTNDGVITLIDFGASKQAAVFGDINADIVLKLGYAPLEQYSRYANQGPFTDLYAVAALFYRLVTGKKPQPANERVHDDQVKAPSDLGIKIPEQAELAMMVCLNLKSEYRLQSAEEFMECLDGADFVPIYDKEWILPEIKENESFLEKIAGLSKVAKISIAVGVLALVSGMAVLGGRMMNPDNKIVEIASEDSENVFADYNGRDFSEVSAELSELGYTNVTATYELSKKERETILSQSVLSGSKIEKTDEIKFTVSGGDEVFTMPDFSGKDQEDLIAFFVPLNYDMVFYREPYKIKEIVKVGADDSGLSKKTGKFVCEREFNDEVERAFVLSQSIAPGELVSVEDEIHIISSMGRKSAVVKKLPDFSGMTEEEVEARIAKMKFQDVMDLEFTYGGYNDSVPYGQVVSQDVEAGTVIDRLKLIANEEKQKVVLTLSSGPQPVVQQPTQNYTPSPAPSQNNTPAPAPAPEPTPEPTPTPSPGWGNYWKPWWWK